MSVDTSKIKAGDTGTIRVTFDDVADTIAKVSVQRSDGGATTWLVPVYLIASHTPAPWVPEKGDVVAWAAFGKGEWTLRAVDGDEAWVSNFASGNAFPRLSSLTLIRKGAA